MINFAHINHYTIDTSIFSNLLHDKIVTEFEERFASYVGAKYACMANSASSLIYLVGREFSGVFKIPSIIPNVVPNAIINSGSNFEFVDDVNWVGGSYVLCESRLLKYKTIDSAQKVERKQFIKEANPQDCMIFSFYPTKPVGGCDGGMIVSDDKGVIDYFKTMVMNGTTVSHNNWERDIKFCGWKMHPNAIQAYIANENLKRLDDKQERLSEIREIYKRAFSLRNSSNHLYRIRVSNNSSFTGYMKKKGVPCGIHYKSLNKHRVYEKVAINMGETLPFSEKEQSHTASLPFHEKLTNDQVQYIVDVTDASTYLI
mgnify:CR=1 FL=1